MGPYYRDRVPIGTFLAFWVPIGSYLRMGRPTLFKKLFINKSIAIISPVLVPSIDHI